MANDLRSLSDGPLVTFGTNFVDVLNGAAAEYGLTQADLDAIQAALDGIATAVTDQFAAEAAFRGAIQLKKERRDAFLSLLSRYSKKFYADPDVDNGELAAVGLQPRDSTRSRVVPKTPVDFIASPRADGTVALKWRRNGNPYGVTFLVEARGDGDSEWKIVKITARMSTVLRGYAPGVRAEFRVLATKGDLTSGPSGVSVIYGTGGKAPFGLAA